MRQVAFLPRGDNEIVEDQGRGGGEGDAWDVIAGGKNTRPGRWHDREVAADHLVGRRGKARDFASLASLASLIASNRCQQMICVGDAKLETARGSRHGFCVCVTRSSDRIGRAWFPD